MLNLPTVGGSTDAWGPLANAAFAELDKRSRAATPEQYGATGNGSSDDTSALQDALDAAYAAQGRVLGTPGATYKVSAPLVIASGVTLDMTGATVTLASGSNCLMLHNAAHVAGSGRDHDIRVVGGTWARGSNDGDTHSIHLQRVDGVSVTDLTATSSAGKYAVHFYACTRFVAARLHFDAHSDGVHINGASSAGLVCDITGQTGDDAVSITGNDYALYSDGDLGTVQDITIERVAVATPLTVVKILPGNDGGSDLTVRRITVRDISASGFAAVRIGGDSGDANTLGGIVDHIVVDGADCTPPSDGAYTVVFTECDGIGTVVLSRLSYGGTHWGFPVEVRASATVRDLTVRDSYLTPVAYACPVNLANGATVTNLRISRCTMRMPNTSGQLVATNGTSTTLTRLFVTDFVAEQGSWCVGDFFGTTALYLSGVDGGGTNGLFYANATAVLDIRGADGQSGTDDFSGASGYAVRSRSLGFRCDVSKLAKNAGDLAYNTNGGLSCGEGPVICNGSAWKHLYTGATY